MAGEAEEQLRAYVEYFRDLGVYDFYRRGELVYVAEEIVAAALSVKFGRPVKWIETRSENLQAQTHGRGQVNYIEAAVQKDGRLLGLKVRTVADFGAFLAYTTPISPNTTARMLNGPYSIPALDFQAVGVFTNLGRDHHDFHGGPEAYFASKASLFTRGRCAAGVVNGDDPAGRRLALIAECATTTVSGVTWPLTIASPSPHAALITTRSGSPLTGSTVNRIPAASAGTRRCTTTARLTAGSMPRRARYASARAVHRLAQQRFTAASSAASPRTFR